IPGIIPHHARRDLWTPRGRRGAGHRLRKQDCGAGAAFKQRRGRQAGRCNTPPDFTNHHRSTGASRRFGRRPVFLRFVQSQPWRKLPVENGALGLLAGGAVIGLIATMWTKFKGLAWRILGLFIQRVEIPTEAGHEAIIAYLIANFRRSRNYDKMYGASWEYQRDGRYGLVPYEVFGNRTLILWNGWFPFFFSNQVESKAASGKGNNESSSGGGMKVYSTITFIRGTLDVEKILKAACAARNNVSWAVEDQQTATKNRFYIHHVPARGDNNESGGSSDG